MISSKKHIFACVLVAGALACGDSGPTPRTLTLAETYDVAGAVRYLEDGIEPSHVEIIYLLFDELSVDGENVTGTIQRKGASERLEAMGRFDSTTGDLIFMPSFFALTGTIAEDVQELGARAEEAKPNDGIGDEAPGFIRTALGVDAKDGTFLAVSRGPNRPTRPDEMKISATVSGLGKVAIVAEPGTFDRNIGVEIFRYRFDEKVPEQTTGIAGEDGSFSLTLDGFEGEVFMFRAIAGGVVSDARGVYVTR